MGSNTSRSTPPFDLEYGSAYNNGDLNAALASENPLSVIPSEDTNGHGTFLAGVAGGSTLPQSDFNGAAPESMLAVVKLEEETKQYLKSLFLPLGICLPIKVQILYGNSLPYSIWQKN